MNATPQFSGGWVPGFPSATALGYKVAMPATTADAGAVGQYAVDGDKLAVYVASIGWLFFTGFQA